MKAKKWLTIITLTVSIVSFVIALIIGKESNCIYYDISMAIFGSAALGFIMSITEYYVERRKAMEEFWVQARKILKKMRKIEHLEFDAPLDLIIEAFKEEDSNEWRQWFNMLSEGKEVHHEAKNSLIFWYEKNSSFPFDNNIEADKVLEEFYKTKMESYKKNFMQCMDSYHIASSVDLGLLNNAYGNLDFIFANRCIRKKAYDLIYEKIRESIIQFKTEVYFFNLLKNGEGSFPLCAIKVSALDKDYFWSKEETIHGYTHALLYQTIFDDIDAALEEFRCKIYRIKYEAPKSEPISSRVIKFGENKDNNLTDHM